MTDGLMRARAAQNARLQRLEIVTEVGISHPDFIDVADSVGPFSGPFLDPLVVIDPSG